MGHFTFHAELFELRNAVLEMLSEESFAWLSDFGSVDLLHDVHGVEVCGIRDESDSRTIQRLLRRMFPEWLHSHRYYKDASTREPGWKVVIARDPEDHNDNWRGVS